MPKAPKPPTKPSPSPKKKKPTKASEASAKKPAKRNTASKLGTPPRTLPKKKIPEAGLSPTEVERMYLISKKANGYTPSEYAKVAYAGSDGWKKDCRTGAGRNSDEVYLVKGGAMNIAAGASLAKMAKAGLLEAVEEGRTKRYFIAAEGRKKYNHAVRIYRERMKRAR